MCVLLTIRLRTAHHCVIGWAKMVYYSSLRSPKPISTALTLLFFRVWNLKYWLADSGSLWTCHYLYHLHCPVLKEKKVIIHIIFLYILIPWSFNITLIYRLYITWSIYSWWRPTKMGDFPPAEPPGLGRILHLCKPLLRKPGRPWWVPRLSVAINPSSPS